MALRAIDDGMKDSSFVKSSTVAGFILTTMSGIFSIITAFVSFSNQKSSGYLGLLLGMFLPAWIAIRFNLVGYINFWQIVFLFVFILEIAISLALIRRHYLKERKKLATKIEQHLQTGLPTPAKFSFQLSYYIKQCLLCGLFYSQYSSVVFVCW